MENAQSFTTCSLLPVSPLSPIPSSKLTFSALQRLNRSSVAGEQRRSRALVIRSAFTLDENGQLNGVSNISNKIFMEEVTKSRASIAFQPVHKTKSVAGSKLFDFGANYDSSQKDVVQELVDQLHWCAGNRLLEEARVIHGRVTKSDYDDQNLLILLNHVMYAYLKSSDFKSAKMVFDYLPRKNVFSWSVMIVGFNQQVSFQDGFTSFCRMMEYGISPDGFAYSSVIQSCIGMNRVDLGDMVHAHIIIRGFGAHVVVSTALLSMYAKLGRVEDACRVFNCMAEHNDISWNAMISGLTTNGLHLEAFDQFVKMIDQGFTPDKFTLVSVLNAVGMLADADRGRQVHKCILELDLQDNFRVGTALIDMYAKCGDLLEARSVFDTNFVNCGANGPWNAMISGYSLGKCSHQAVQLFVKMCENDIKPDLYTYCSVFDAIANFKCLLLVKEVHAMVLKSGDDLNVSVENAILDAYSKCGSLGEVNKIFNMMTCRDIVSWTTLVAGYSQCLKWEEALNIFFRMMKEGFIPNSYTLSSILTACADLCYLECGRQIHGLLCKLGFQTVRFVESALVDMYAKGGCINAAEKVFSQISNPDVVSLTAMLSGYAYHGSAAHALAQFKRMEEMHIKPNAVTFLCVLFACSHAGLIEEGLKYFWSMEKDYGLVPTMEHYACVVDLLGRVGRLDEAHEFIMKMPVEPDEMVWQSLLAACRTHGSVEFGEIAAKKILSLRSEYSSTYVLLANTYMETGSMRDGVDLRKVMKEKGVRKEAGYSWISVKGRVHRFYAGDTDHPQKDSIYAKLEELRHHVNKLGYDPELKYALHVED